MLPLNLYLYITTLYGPSSPNPRLGLCGAHS